MAQKENIAVTGKAGEEDGADFPKEEKVAAGEAKKRKSTATRFPRLQKWGKRGLILLLVLVLVLLGVDRFVVESTRGRIVTVENLPAQPVDAIVVLGAQVKPDGTLSAMLRDRMEVGISLYKAGVSERLLLSGDGRTADYDEPAAMKSYAMAQGVPEEAIVLDKAGLSTYDSIGRAKQIGGYTSLAIVSQQYHLHRALHIAASMAVEGVGVPADLVWYGGQSKRELREILARNKDVVTCLVKVDPLATENAWIEPEKIQ